MHLAEGDDMNLPQGHYGLWLSCQHYSGHGRDRYERGHDLPSRWPGHRPRYVAADIVTLVALCDRLPASRGNPFIANWDGKEWQTVGMVWPDGHVELKDTTSPEKYDAIRRGERKSSYPSSYPQFEAIDKDDAPTQYIWADTASATPGKALEGLDPEMQDEAIAAVESVSNPRRTFGSNLTADETKAVEQRAVQVTRDHFHALGYDTQDVGSIASYDVHATKDEQMIKVEVKGTTSDGAAVLLTANEVELHRSEHPDNALAVVRHIILDRRVDGPTATGGELVLKMPWKVAPDRLEPVAYRYRTGLRSP